VSVHFFKYQATGNDFVILDNREGKHILSEEQIKKICDRKFGVGADGIMLIENHPSLDFLLQYYNSDGSQSLCGNGSRAAVNFAAKLGIIHGKTSFMAYDGEHAAELLKGEIVSLRMNDVSGIKKVGDDFFLNTGSPHFVRFVDDIKSYPVVEEGRAIRYSEAFKPGGTNVNFVERIDVNTLYVRTYERGVEDETLSCGTGVTAAAIAASLKGYQSPVIIKTQGGDLSVSFKKSGRNDLSLSDSSGKDSQPDTFTDIFLIGPAKMVFEGTLEL
jgi:diaminopimelate epimerase